MAIAYQHVREEPVPPSEVDPATPSWADSIVLKAMTKDADNRYQSAAEMRADIQRALAGQEVTAPVTATQRLGAADTAGGGTRALPRNGDEPSDGRRRRQRSPWVWIALLLILALALAGVGGWLLTRGLRDSGPPQVKVPRVIGMSEKGARSTLRNENLKVNVTRDFTNKVNPGNVFNQRPPAGRRIAAGSVVTIFVSKGRATVEVPSVVGESRSSAVAAMERRGLTTAITETPSNRPEGTVVKTQPAGGERVRRGTQVQLVVSSGPATTTVPSVLGEQVDDARSTLRQQGFQVNVTYRTNTAKEPGTVFDQTPDGGTRVKKGSSVTIFVAQSAEETQEPSPSPSPTSPTEDDDILGWGQSGGSDPPGLARRQE